MSGNPGHAWEGELMCGPQGQTLQDRCSWRMTAALQWTIKTHMIQETRPHVVSHKIGLCRELLGYFGLFLIRFCKEGKFSGKKERKNVGQPGAGWAVMKKLADFELPYVSLRSSEVENCKVGLRK
ncbi:hypothetical protein HPG69_011665, partial [Diceros bicornis minor]